MKTLLRLQSFGSFMRALIVHLLVVENPSSPGASVLRVHLHVENLPPPAAKLNVSPLNCISPIRSNAER